MPIEYVKKQLAQKVKSINLANSGIVDDDIRGIVQTINNTPGLHLYELNLDCNNISDEGFTELLTLKGVDRINLDRNNVSQTGLKKLFSSKECAIKYINLSRNALGLAISTPALSSVTQGEDLVKLISDYDGSVKLQITSGNGLTLTAIKEIENIQEKKHIMASIAQQATDSKESTDHFVASVEHLKKSMPKI